MKLLWAVEEQVRGQSPQARLAAGAPMSPPGPFANLGRDV
jgi:hypothetical protein